MYVVDYLRSQCVAFEAFLHFPASSATRLAGHMHVPGRYVLKSVLLEAQGVYLLAVLPATKAINLERFSHILGLGADDVKLATAGELERIFRDCEPGTIPQFGRLYGLRTVADVSLEGAGVLVFRTNSRHLGIRMQFKEYERLERPLWADFARPIGFEHGPTPSGERHRCAG
jgi:Ala-tRNA(Pro) deacylase